MKPGNLSLRRETRVEKVLLPAAGFCREMRSDTDFRLTPLKSEPFIFRRAYSKRKDNNEQVFFYLGKRYRGASR